MSGWPPDRNIIVRTTCCLLFWSTNYAFYWTIMLIIVKKCFLLRVGRPHHCNMLINNWYAPCLFPTRLIRNIIQVWNRLSKRCALRRAFHSLLILNSCFAWPIFCQISWRALAQELEFTSGSREKCGRQKEIEENGITANIFICN